MNKNPILNLYLFYFFELNEKFAKNKVQNIYCKIV